MALSITDRREAALDLRQLRRRCEARLRELDVPEPFDVRIFCGMLAAGRGRPIALEPVNGFRGPFGLWVASPKSDIVFYERETSAPHQDHIILHELCHILCGHSARPETSDMASAALFSALSPEIVRHVLQRAAYATEEEREAELMASLILARVTQTEQREQGDSATIRRLSATLEDR